MFIYLCHLNVRVERGIESDIEIGGKESKRISERKSSIHGFIALMFTLSQSQELAAPSRSPAWMAGTQVLRLLPPRDCPGRKLESRGSSHSDKRCGHP